MAEHPGLCSRTGRAGGTRLRPDVWEVVKVLQPAGAGTTVMGQTVTDIDEPTLEDPRVSAVTPRYVLQP